MTWNPDENQLNRYKKMWYECQCDNFQYKSQFVKGKPSYGLQYGAFAHTKQQAIKGPKNY